YRFQFLNARQSRIYVTGFVKGVPNQPHTRRVAKLRRSLFNFRSRRLRINRRASTQAKKAIRNLGTNWMLSSTTIAGFLAGSASEMNHYPSSFLTVWR